MLEKLLDKIRRRKSLQIIALLGPPLVVLSIFFTIPFGICLFYSFGYYGVLGMSPPPTFRYYLMVLDPLYLGIFGRSVVLAVFTVSMCLLLGYPVAYCIALKGGRIKNALMTLIIIPYWVNFLVRTYALMTILDYQGVINTLLLRLGLISEPLTLLYTPTAVYIAMVIDYLPFTILPLYASVEKLDVSLIEASKTLGAGPFRTFIHITLPLTRPGIAAGSLLTFIPAVAEYIVPTMMGGPGEFYVGNLIWSTFLSARNWWFGSAFSIIFIVIVLVSVMVYMRYVGEEITI